MKDYGEASCSGASAEPIKDTDLSEPLPEFETRIKERESMPAPLGASFE